MEESTPTGVSTSNDTIVDTPSQTSANTSQVSQTDIFITDLEKKITSRFDDFDNELLNLKDIIIKPSSKYKHLRNKFNLLEGKVLTY